tara:strand:- start:1897 stop:2529 length:633 start_codon:yes stop_codon:yes gene_type:complete
MYMGLVQGVARITTAEKLPGRIAFTLDFPESLTEGLILGASVSVEGVCLSVTRIDGAKIGFDATKGTLDNTNLGGFRHDRVNIERSAKLGDEIGGHIVAGHISGTAEVVALEIDQEDHMWMKLQLPEPWSRYVFNRGFLAINGCSLTVAAIDDGVITINLIPETLRQTTFGLYHVGDHVNFEVDQQSLAMVETIERTVTNVLERLVPQSL